MAACIQLYKKTTLPPLLDNYLPVHYRNQNSENQEKPDKKKQMRNNKQALSEEEKDEIIKQALKEQHHLETFNNLYKLKNVLCEEYKTLLNEKVQKQRIQIKMSNVRVQQHIKHAQKEYIPSHKVPFCKLSHDAKYLETIPKSSSYLSTAASLLQSAGTCQLPTHHMSKQMTTQTPTKEISPKLLLSEVQKRHGEQPSRTQQVNQTFKRNRRYERHLHYLHHMYNFSLLNMASSKRLLEKNGQFSDFRKEQTIHDLIHLLGF